MKKVVFALMLLSCCAAYASDITLSLSSSSCTTLGGGSVQLSDLWRSSDLKTTYSDNHTEGPKIGNSCQQTTGWVCEGPQKMYVQYEDYKSGYGCQTCDETWTVINDITYDTVSHTRIGPDYQHDGPNCF